MARAKKIQAEQQCEKCGRAHHAHSLDVAIENGSTWERATVRLCASCMLNPFDMRDEETGEALESFYLNGGRLPAKGGHLGRQVIGVIGSPAFPE